MTLSIPDSRPAISLPGPLGTDVFWLDTSEHREWLAADAHRQFEFFRASLSVKKGFRVLGASGSPLQDAKPDLLTTTRLIHSYALGKLAGVSNCDEIIDRGMRDLWNGSRDGVHGGYFWSRNSEKFQDGRKFAYGHVFVLLAGASARMAGHPDADRLIDDVSDILDKHFSEKDTGLFSDEWNRDWTPFSTYRGMNANMHGVEALLTAFEATGCEIFLTRAGRILEFFANKIAPHQNWRLPEHYNADWKIDYGYSGNPMFRPAGTTPGHSFEIARLLLQHWDLCGRPQTDALVSARRLVEQALTDAWDAEHGGLIYTLDFDGNPAISTRFWWPVAEAICVLAMLIKLERKPEDEIWYRRLWQFADKNFIDHSIGGWFPEINDNGKSVATLFEGKPDIYHSIQAVLFPLAFGLSRVAENLPSLSDS